LYRKSHLIDSRVAVHSFQLRLERSIAQLRKLDAVRHGLVEQAGIAVQHGAAVLVDDGDVVDCRRVADDTLHQRGEPRIRLQYFGDGNADLLGIGEIDPGALEVDLEGLSCPGQNLVSYEVGTLVGFLNPLTHQLGDVNPREGHHQSKNHGGDRQHEFGLQAQSRHPELGSGYPVGINRVPM